MALRGGIRHTFSTPAVSATHASARPKRRKDEVEEGGRTTHDWSSAWETSSAPTTPTYTESMASLAGDVAVLTSKAWSWRLPHGTRPDSLSMGSGVGGFAPRGRSTSDDDSEITESARPLTPDELPRLGLPSVDSGEWGSLNAIFWRPWFTRVWIIQELAVSKEALVVCGDISFTWVDLARASQYILRHSLTAITKVDPRRPIKLEIFRQAHLNLKGDQPLLPLLLEARDTFATDDRDKVFALMGLSKQETSSFVPDYSISIEEVFVNFSKYHIERTGTLDILGAVEDHSFRLKRELSSWVPDWEVHPPSLALFMLDQYSSWDASMGLRNRICVAFSSDNRSLTVKGVTIDTVLHIGDSFLEYVPLPGTSRDWLPHLKTEQAKKLMLSISDFHMQQRYLQWQKIAQRNKQHLANEDFLSAFIRILTADATIVSHTPETTDAVSNNEEVYIAWCKYWSAASQFQGKHVSTSYNSATPAELAMAATFMQAHHKAAYGRRFFTSKSHGHMGLCPSLTRKGDKLVVLFDGRTPFIIRDVGRGRFKFIGECYTHGLMQGELSRQETIGGAEWRAKDYIII